MYVLGCALRLHLSFPIESLSFAAMTYKYVQVAELFCISTGHEFFESPPSPPPLKTSYRELWMYSELHAMLCKEM